MMTLLIVLLCVAPVPLLWAFGRPTRTERIEAAEKSLRERERAIEVRQRELEAASRKLDLL